MYPRVGANSRKPWVCWTVEGQGEGTLPRPSFGWDLALISVGPGGTSGAFAGGYGTAAHKKMGLGCGSPLFQNKAGGLGGGRPARRKLIFAP